MAERPIFVPAADSSELVKEIYLPLKWHAGFAPVQKEKNVLALHAAAATAGFAPLLEVSSRSAEQLGRHLSAFYINAIYPHREWLATQLSRDAGFTDIEFNPERSVNCQARSCALFVSMMTNDLLDRAVQSPRAFVDLLTESAYRPQLAERAAQRVFAKRVSDRSAESPSRAQAKAEAQHVAGR